MTGRMAFWLGVGLSGLCLPACLLGDEPEVVGSAWTDTRNPIRKIWEGARLDLWSLKPLEASPLGDTAVSGQVTANPIDAWIEKRLHISESDSARVLGRADRRTLLRRLSYDLTGLPPTLVEVRAFESDVRPGAYERCVERLLSSPRYGEHQARLWLDVVRYSDSNGFDWDEYRKEAWRFRDYVIRAFNADKPFNRFVVEQLAGDEMVEGDPRTEVEQDALIATGYLRLGPHDNAAPLFNEQDRSRAELLTDLVETTAGAFLGLTFSCCRCHDHKTDPFSQEDHYRFRAFFEAVTFADKRPINLASDLAGIRQQNQALEARAAVFEKERNEVLEPVRNRLRSERVSSLPAADQAVLAKAKEQRSADEVKRAEMLEKSVQPADEDLLKALPAEDRSRCEALTRSMEEVRRQKLSETHGLLMTDATGTPPVTRVLFQGNHKSPREEVVPGFPTVFGTAPAPVQKGANPETTGRRLALAQWITSTTNPWTARVFVNRVWQQHFGHGLVATPNDFGVSGAKPTHPELLDWLAADFMRHGWSVKQLHRRIVTSEAYQRRSFAGADAGVPSDEGNTLLWRQNPKRLSAEQLRDSLLAAAGTLADRRGGPPVWPELPAEVLTANPAFLDDNETRTKGWYPSPLEMQGARSVYLVQKRTVRVPFMETFDLPENSTSCARRTESTVAPQALSLLNSPFAVEASKAFAARITREGGQQPEEQVRRGFEIALQREPTPRELSLSLELIRKRSLPEFARAVLNLNEFVYLD